MEYWRDDNNFFVASFPTKQWAQSWRSKASVPPIHAAPGSNTTYGALTLGVTW